MRRWFSNTSLQKKLLISYILLFAVSLVAFLVVFVFYFNRDIKTELSHMEENNGQLELNMDKLLEDLESFGLFHFSDNKIRNLIASNDSDIDLENHREMEEKIVERISLLADMEPYLLRATVLTEDGRVYKNVQEDQSDYISRMKKYAGYVTWKRGDSPFVCDLRKEKINLVSYKVISLIYPIWNVSGEEPIGFVFLDLDYSKFVEYWNETAKISRNSDFMVLSRGHVLYDSAVEPEAFSDTEGTEIVKMRSSGSGDGIYRIRGERCVTSIFKYNDTGWWFVQYMQIDYFIQRVLENLYVFMIVLGAVIVFTIFGSFISAKAVSHPVRVLSDEMGKVALDFNEEQEIPLFDHPEIRQVDEVGRIIQSYNAMAKRINDNIIKTYMYKLRQKQTELKMLQFQINPHFLYNALNTISAIAKLENVDHIPEIATNLSDMFRYNISDREFVTLGEELEHTLHYMSIQKIRFPDRFEVITEVDEQFLRCEVLKFILQPIVENSYKYGFKIRGRKDIICIRAYQDNETDMILSVEDNGVGMEKDRLDQVNESLLKSKRLGENSGIGLQNVNERLKNYYGESYGIRVESEAGCFTRVNLRIRFSDRTDGEM